MVLQLTGYIRTNPGGAAVSGVTVNLLDSSTGVAPVTNAFTNLSGTSSVTDGTGKWSFSMDLCTGPLRVEADLGGGNKRHRRSDELFQYDGMFIHRIDDALRAFQNGVVYGSGSEFGTSASATRVLTIGSGTAIIRGYPFGWSTATKSITGAANGSGSTRYDFLVLRQWHAGSSQGKQDIVLVQGGAVTDPVVTSTESDLTKFIQGVNIWDLPIYRAKLASSGTVYTLDNLVTTNEWTYANPRIQYIPNAITTGSSLTTTGTISAGNNLNVTGDVVHSGSTQLGDSTADKVTLYGHIEVQGASPTVSALASTYNTAGNSVFAGTDTSFTLQGTTKSPPVAGVAFSVTFATARANTQYTVTVQPRSLTTATGQWYVISKTTAGFDIACGNVIASGAALTLDVQVI